MKSPHFTPQILTKHNSSTGILWDLGGGVTQRCQCEPGQARDHGETATAPSPPPPPVERTAAADHAGHSITPVWHTNRKRYWCGTCWGWTDEQQPTNNRPAERCRGKVLRAADRFEQSGRAGKYLIKTPAGWVALRQRQFFDRRRPHLAHNATPQYDREHGRYSINTARTDNIGSAKRWKTLQAAKRANSTVAGQIHRERGGSIVPSCSCKDAPDRRPKVLPLFATASEVAR